VVPSQFDAVARVVRPEDLEGGVRISADPRQHLEWLQQDIELGVSDILRHNVNREQEPFIAAFGEHVLPVLQKV
jgi:alkanesulfonate monooxygenase SsuD/methylene tetrahydromethanopterin reductase-like flavin-dependent oxidoreductase (luciferase family)